MFERRLYFHIDWLLFGAVLLLTAVGFGQQLVAAGCDGSQTRRVEAYRWDPVLRQRWAVRFDCCARPTAIWIFWLS